MPIIDGISVIAVYDPVTGDSVEISKPIANTFEFSRVDFDTGELSPTGGRLYQGDSSSCSFSFLDPDGSVSYQLRSWKEARTRVSMVAVGPSVAVQWYEKDHISITPSTLGGMIRGRGDRWDFEIRREGHGSHAIYKRANLLSHLDWIDSDSDNIADGYTSTAASVSFASGVQTVSDLSATVGIYADVIFPIKSIGSLVLSSNITELHSQSGQAQIRAQQLSFAESTLGTSNSNFSSTGRQSVTISNLDNNIYKIRVYPIVTPTGTTLTGSCSASDPALRLDGSTAYTQG